MLWQNRLILLIILVSLINIISCYGLQASPGSLEFSGKINQQLCRQVYIDSENLILDSRWSLQNSRDLTDYRLNNYEVGISGEFLGNKICISGTDPGICYGALLFHEPNSKAGVGIWARVDLFGEKKSTSLLTGNVVGSSDYSILMILSAFSFILIIVLLFLTSVNRRLRKTPKVL